MELRHLEYFLMVSKELHFTKAAEKLGISQPTLSHQIKLLEKEIGFALFNRVGKKVELTKVGEIVQQQAITIQDSVDAIQTRIKEISNLQVGELKIAVLPGELTDLISTICIHFHQLYPDIKVIIETTDQIEEALQQKKADFGIGFRFHKKDWLQTTKLYEEEFYVISNEPFSTKAADLAEVLQRPLILFPKEQQCRKLLNNVSEQLSLKVNPLVETSSINSILHLVRNGVGQSIVSRTLFEFYDTADLYFQHIENPKLDRTVYLKRKKDCFVNYAAREYMKLFLQEIEKLHFQLDDEVLQTISILE